MTIVQFVYRKVHNGDGRVHLLRYWVYLLKSLLNMGKYTWSQRYTMAVQFSKIIAINRVPQDVGVNMHEIYMLFGRALQSSGSFF